MSAENGLHWMRIHCARGLLWLDKRRLRVLAAAQCNRLVQPWRQIRADLRRPVRNAWATLAAEHCRALGIDWEQQLRRGLAAVAEPAGLVASEYDAYGRLLWLRADAQQAWSRMRRAAAADGITLCAVSGWRSIHYQAQLLARKLARGQSLPQILKVSAAPGFSEHHGGTALDLAQAGDLALEERFEHSAAFAWLTSQANRFGFCMSLPRDNAYGYSYEPWHWRLR